MKLIVPLAAVLVSAIAATPAAAASCTKPYLITGSGLGIVEIRASGTGCTVARQVAKRATSRTDGRVRERVTVSGTTWRCRVTQQATGTDPGSVARTKIRCTAGKRVVRLQLAS